MDIEQLIKKYVEEYEGCTYTYIANKILQEESTGLSHRTLREKVSIYDKKLKESKDYPGVGGEPFTIEFNDSMWVKEPRLQPYLGGDPNVVLIIGDIHEPFCREGYLEHCREYQEALGAGTVVFIGDILDSHYSSFHPSDPDGYGAGEELDRAMDKIAEWYRVFPVAKVCLGNHDQIIQRKAFASGVSKRWVRGLGEVLQTPNWEYDIEFVINNVLYTHTLGANLINAAINRRQSVVAGHIHTKATIEYNVNKQDRIFAMQVGCGIDDSSYAFAYAKLNVKKSIISCGAVVNDIPMLIPMQL